MQETDTKLLQSKLPLFLERFGNDIQEVQDVRGDLSLTVAKEKIRDMVQFLFQENTPRMDMLVDLFAMDYLKLSTPTAGRFAMIYNFNSIQGKRRVRLKVFLNEENPEIDSISDLTAMANWFEREAYDLFGIQFKGHPHLERILCHQDFEGHPLRKDYPADGYQRLKNAAPSSGF